MAQFLAGGYSRAYNLGTRTGYSLLEAIHTVERITHTKVRLQEVGRPCSQPSAGGRGLSCCSNGVEGCSNASRHLLQREYRTGDLYSLKYESAGEGMQQQHQDTLQALFAHPIQRGIHLTRAIDLCRALGAEVSHLDQNRLKVQWTHGEETWLQGGSGPGKNELHPDTLMRLRQLLEQQGISLDHPESFNEPERRDQSHRLVIRMDHRHCDIFHLVGTDVEHAVLRPHGLWGTARHRLSQTHRASHRIGGCGAARGSWQRPKQRGLGAAQTPRTAQAPVVGADDAGEHQQKTPPLGRGGRSQRSRKWNHCTGKGAQPMVLITSGALLALIFFRSLRLKRKAAARPRIGRGPGTFTSAPRQEPGHPA